jgi:hypothetical protein
MFKTSKKPWTIISDDKNDWFASRNVQF